MQIQLPPFEIISYKEMLTRLPELARLKKTDTSPDEAEDDDDNDDAFNDDDDKVIYFDGDTTLTEDQKMLLRDHPSGARVMAVKGNLELTGGSRDNLYISGDLHCNAYYQGYEQRIGGTIFARHYACFSGEDHEILHTTYPCKVNTPYLFAWFFDIGSFIASDKTVAFVMCNYTDYQKMELSNPHFYWQEDIYVLKPEMCYEVESRFYDSIYWNLDNIRKALEQGQSIFIEGFDINSWAQYKKAQEYIQARQKQEAFACHRKAMELSPNWYRVWLDAGQLLFNEGAYEQALPYLEKAVDLFPQKHKNINNRAADLYALAQTRLRRLDNAIEMATYSIESSKANPYDEDRRYFAYRIRGEAYVLKGEWDAARADLEQAVNMAWDNGSANWLLGLVYRHLGDVKKENKYYEIAKKKGEKFAADYATHNHADFVYKFPTTVNYGDQ
ncbi:MAG TPA: tetratricopeptide repeat protein [Niastella sp.]